MNAIHTDADLTYARWLTELPSPLASDSSRRERRSEWGAGWRRGFAEGFIAAAVVAGLWLALAR